MAPGQGKAVAALAIACVALALAIHAELRGGAAGPGSAAAVDPVARDQVAQLRRALAERDAIAARLAPPSAGAAAAIPAGGPPPAPAPGPEPRRYVRFEIPNPAVRVTQHDDGSFDIRSTDPGLAGQVMTITAISDTGAEDKIYIRVP